MAKVLFMYGQQATEVIVTHVQQTDMFRASTPLPLELFRAMESVLSTMRDALQRLHQHLLPTPMFSVP